MAKKKLDVEGALKFAAGCATDWKIGDVGIKVLDLNNMLYPQHEIDFRTIRPDAWAKLQFKALETLQTSKNLAPHVREHLRSIIEGKVPFGYVVTNL